MSESRAKRERKQQSAETVKTAQKKSPMEIIISVASVLLVVAVAGLGGYAIKDNIKAILPEKPQPQIETVGDYAESIETTAEELLAKCGMEDSGLTADSDVDEMYEKFTIDSYAKFTDTDAESLKAINGIEDLPNDTLWSDAQNKVPMYKIAEQSGMTFEEFAQQNQLPAEITKDTTYEEALKVMEEQMAAASVEGAETPDAEESSAETVEIPATTEE